MFTIFKKLGGLDPAFDVIAKRTGKRPTARALKHWRMVRKLPTSVKLALMLECAERDIPFDLADCVIPDSVPRRGVRAPEQGAAA